MLITPDNYQTKEEYQTALEDEAEKCKSFALTVVESLDFTSYQVPVFDVIDKYLKFAEGSIKKARKIIKKESQSREVNRRRQIEELIRKAQQRNDND